MARVAELVDERLGMTLEDIPDLPLKEGFAAGESPDAFVAGSVREFLDELETRPGHR